MPDSISGLYVVDADGSPCVCHARHHASRAIPSHLGYTVAPYPTAREYPMSVYDIDIKGLDGGPALLDGLKGKAALFVNVASKCGLNPQYTPLEAFHEKLGDPGFSVVGFPCNQFRAQE